MILSAGETGHLPKVQNLIDLGLVKELGPRVCEIDEGLLEMLYDFHDGSPPEPGPRRYKKRKSPVGDNS